MPAASTASSLYTPRGGVLGAVGTSIYAGQIDDHNDENALTRGSNWYGSPSRIGEAQKMCFDPYAWRSLDSIASPVVGATWDFESRKRTDLDREVEDFLRYNFFEINKWSHFLRASMFGYLRDGASLFEQTDEIRPIPKNRFPSIKSGKALVLTGLHYRPLWSVSRWGQSPKDPATLDYIDQLVGGSDVEKAGTRRIPSDRLVRFSWDAEGANFAGRSVLRRAWGSWYAKRLLLRVEVQSHEKNHMALPFMEAPVGAPNLSDEELKKAIKAMSEFRAHERGANVVPTGYSINFKSGQANTDIQATIDRLNRDIMINVAAPFMIAGNNGAQYASASTQEGQFHIMLESHAKFIQDVFNIGSDGWSLVERLVRANFGPDVEIPNLIVHNMPTFNFKDMLPIAIAGKQAGIYKGDREVEKYFRKGLRMPEIDETTREEYATAQPVPSSTPGVVDGKDSNAEKSDLGNAPE